MSLQSGDVLGRYRVIEEIGAGGMGVVYRAFDERLGRDVALKVVSDDVSNDPELISRFKREAKAVAKLGHPNIVALHDFVEEGEVVFAVMECLKGETLRDRLERKPLSSDETAKIAVGVAEGLAAALKKGSIAISSRQTSF